MDGRAEHGERPSLCAATLQYLADEGFIDPTSDPRLAVRTALQDLHVDHAQDEQDLTDDDSDDAEKLAAQLIEPRGVNPQQRVFTEKPTGPTDLVEEGKALIARTRLLPEDLVKQDSKPVLRFDGRDEVVLPRATLKDTPSLTRKSTFKPLVAKHLLSEVQEALQSVKVPDATVSDDPPREVKPIDTCLKLGLAASRDLFSKTQDTLALVQNTMKREGKNANAENLLHEMNEQVMRPPTPVLLPRPSSDLASLDELATLEKPDMRDVLQNHLAIPSTPSSHAMSQLMQDVDRWGGRPATLSPFVTSSGSTKPTSPLMASDSFSPGGMLTLSVRTEVPLLPRGAVSPRKRNLSPDHEGVNHAMKKLRSSEKENASTAPPLSRLGGGRVETATLKETSGVDCGSDMASQGSDSELATSHSKSASHASRTVPTLTTITQNRQITSLTETLTGVDPSASRDAAHDRTMEWASLSSKSATFQSIAQMYEDDDEEVDELASSVEDIEEFCDISSTPVLLARSETRAAPSHGLPSATEEQMVSGEQMSGQSPNAARQAEARAESEPSGTNDGIVFTPQDRSAGNYDITTSVPARPEVTEPQHPHHPEDIEDASGWPQGGDSGDFFMEERTQVKHPEVNTCSGRMEKPAILQSKPRQPLTQLSMEGLAALVASKRRKKQKNGRITDFFGQKDTRERSETPKRDFANVNGYLVLRSRSDIIKERPSRSATPAKTAPVKPKQNVGTWVRTAPPEKSVVPATVPKIASTPPVPLKPVQQVVQTPKQAAPRAPIEPTYDLTTLTPVRCFGSFRLLQNVAVDRALDMHNVEVIYPEEADPVNLRAASLSKNGRPRVFAQITQPDIILSPRACLFYYRLSYIYQLTTVLDNNFEQKRIHHSKILLDAIKLLSVQYDKIVLVLEVFEPPAQDGKRIVKYETPKNPFTPPIKRALEKLHNDIGTLADDIQRPPGEELDIELLYAINPMHAAAFARERLDMRYAEDIQLGQVGWDQKLFEIFNLNDLSAHHLVIEAGSLEAFQEMPEEERVRRFSEVMGPDRLDKINRNLRSQAAFGTLNQTNTDTRASPFEITYGRGTPENENRGSEQDMIYSDSFFEHPNYSAYTYPADSYSQANLTQTRQDPFINATTIFDSNNSPTHRNETTMTHSPHFGSPHFQYEMDELDDLILDDADVEAEISEPVVREITINRPFTPIHEMGNFWPPNVGFDDNEEQANYQDLGLTEVQPLYYGYDNILEEDGNDPPVYEFDDAFHTITEFDPDIDMGH